MWFDANIRATYRYGEGDIAMGPSMIEKVQSYGKTFIVDEYGFFSNASVYVALNQSPEAKEIAGMLVWSLRPHSSNGGFLVHDEGKASQLGKGRSDHSH